MAPLAVLLGAFLVFLLCGRLGMRPLFESWVTSLRWALAATFFVTASAHFTSLRPDLVRMVPPFFENPELWVTLSGIAEFVLAAGLLFPRTAPWAASMLALLLVLVFPANIYAAHEGLTVGGRPVPGVVPRAFMQLVFLAALVVAGVGPRLRARARRRSRPFSGFPGDAALKHR